MCLGKINSNKNGKLLLLLTLVCNLNAVEAIFCPPDTPTGCFFWIFGYTMRSIDPDQTSCTEICSLFPPITEGYECGECNKSPTPAPTPDGPARDKSACRSLKSSLENVFDETKVNIIFVGSAFTSSEAFEIEVQKIYKDFTNFNMFGTDNPQYHAYYVTPTEGMEPSFCDFNCAGIPRLLCCDLSTARRLANKCLRSSSTLQTVVVHNNGTYGGSGSITENLATVSIHDQAPLIAVHEFGHSLFEFNDEYDAGDGTPAFPNCDDKNCNKWSDLIGRNLAGHNPVSCVPACQGKSYFAGELSFMYRLHDPVGAVNERFTCCTYLALTGIAPPYCDIFEFSPGYLLDYCKRDYQNYGAGSYPGGTRGIPGDENSNYVYLDFSVSLVQITLRDGEIWEVEIDPTPIGPGIHRRGRVQGDFSSFEDARQNGVDNPVTVLVFHSSSLQASPKTFYFDPYADVSIPLEMDGVQTNKQTTSTRRTVFELVVGVQPDEIVNVVVESN